MRENEFKTYGHKDGQLKKRIIMIAVIIGIGVMIVLIPVLFAAFSLAYDMGADG